MSPPPPRSLFLKPRDSGDFINIQYLGHPSNLTMESGSLSRKPIPDDKFLNALADAFRLQESILNAIHLSITSTSVEGIITSMNKKAEELFGYSAEELIGKSSPFIFHD